MSEEEEKYRNLLEGEGHLKYIIDNPDSVDTVVLGMLKSNRIPGLLDVRIQQRNEELTLVYDTEKLTNVKSYLAEAEWLLSTVEVLEKLTGIIQCLAQYMIEEDYLILDSSYMYLNGEGDLFCVCTPDVCKGDGSFKEFAISLIKQFKIMRYSEIEPRKRLEKCLMKESFTIEQFSNELASLRLELKKNYAGRIHSQESGKVVLNRMDRLISGTDLEKEGQRMDGLAVEGDDGAGENNEEESIVVLSRKKDVSSEELLEMQSDKTIMGGMRQQHRKRDTLENLYIKDKNPDVVLTRKRTNVDGRNTDEKTEKFKQEHCIGLFRKKTQETLWLDKEHGFIGRGKTGVDIVIADNVLISKKHAELYRRGNKYFLMDKNSTNRTFLNGRLLQYEEEYEVKDGDIIKFANELFELKSGLADSVTGTT